MGVWVGSMAGKKGFQGPYCFPGLHCDLSTRGFGRAQINTARSREVLTPILRQTDNSRLLQSAIVSKGQPPGNARYSWEVRGRWLWPKGESTIFSQHPADHLYGNRVFQRATELKRPKNHPAKGWEIVSESIFYQDSWPGTPESWVDLLRWLGREVNVRNFGPTGSMPCHILTKKASRRAWVVC